jgi:hypothetical protein
VETAEPAATETPEAAAVETAEPAATGTAEPPATETPGAVATETPAPAASETPAPAAGETPAPASERRKPERPRRRRLSAAERHRRTFFAKLSELRKTEQAAVDSPPEPEPAADGEAPAAAEGEQAPAAPQRPEAPATSPSRSARAQARLVAAIERVGGHEVVLAALQPKRREDGETMKWSSVCAEQAAGVKPGDPVFTAWVRLAATPVRDVKAIVNPRGADDRGGRRGRGGGGRGRSGGDRGERGGGGGARREELATHGRDGSFRSSVRIVNVEDSRKEREEERRAEREAKRKAEAERLARLGY